MKLDLHVHFDNRRSIKENVKYLSGLQIDGIGLCSFRDISYIKQVQEKLPNKIVIVGQEIFSESLHILALGINKIIVQGLTLKETMLAIRSQEALAILAHPVIQPAATVKFLGKIEQYGFDAVEGFNGLLGHLFIPNSIAQLVCRIKNIPWIAASDAHSLEYVGSSYIDIPCDNSADLKQVFRFIRNGEFLVRKKSYLHFRHFFRSFTGFRCALCNSRVIFGKEFYQLHCEICQELDRTNFVCKKGHYVCEACFLNIC